MPSSSAWQIHLTAPKSWLETKSLENLHLNNDLPKPTAIPAGSVLVRIRAAAINARDVMVIANDPIYPTPNIDDLIPCADGAGEIEAVGEGSVWKVGDRVIILPFDPKSKNLTELESIDEWGGKGAGTHHGTLRQYAVLGDDHFIKAPDHLNFEELAGITAAGATAVHALFFGPAKVGKGTTVLTQGTGGVSCYAIQLATAAGATVIATSSSDAKLEIAKKIGATNTINYVQFPEWEKEVLRLTGGKGVDHVVEIGGSATIEQSLASTKVGGLVSLVGFLSGSKKTDIVMPLLFGAKTLKGVLGYTREHCELAIKLVEEHKIQPLVGAAFEWEDAVKAFTVSMSNSVPGKVIIKV